VVLAAITCTAAAETARPIAVDTVLVTFSKTAPETRRFGALAWRGGVELASNDSAFGGYSGLVVGSDGRSLIAVSDAGAWLTAEIVYENGRLAGLADMRTAPLLDAEGKPFPDKDSRDAEALTVLDPADGILAVGFERMSRVLRYAFGTYGVAARPTTIALPADLRGAPFNKELEALGRFAETDTLLVLSERYLDAEGNIRGWLIGGPQPGALSVVRSGDFDVTDLAIAPSGDVILLERRYSPLAGAAMRIRRIAGETVRAAAFVDGDVLIEARQPHYAIDNMEGIAVHVHDAGEMRLTIISDDNFNPPQRTLLLQFALIE